MSSTGSFSWFLVIAFSVLISLLLGLTLVWLNIQRVDLAYGLKQLQNQINLEENNSAKLEVERDNLLSPYHLSKVAEQIGMKAAQAGQIRRLGKTQN